MMQILRFSVGVMGNATRTSYSSWQRNYCSQNGGNLSRVPYSNLKHNQGARIIVIKDSACMLSE